MSLLLNHTAFACTKIDQDRMRLVLRDAEGLLAEHHIDVNAAGQSVRITAYVVGPNQYGFYLTSRKAKATEDAIIDAALSLRPSITHAAVLSAYVDIKITDRLAEMNANRIAAIWDAGQDLTSVFHTELYGGALRISFLPDAGNARYSMFAESAGNGMVRIETWIVTKSRNFGFNIEDVIVTERGFVAAVLGLKPMLKIEEVQAAFDKMWAEAKRPNFYDNVVATEQVAGSVGNAVTLFQMLMIEAAQAASDKA